MSALNRTEIAGYILDCLRGQIERLQTQFHASGRISTCWADNLLPDLLARRIHDAFPPTGRMMFKNSIKERKYVAAQMNHYEPILEEAVFAFQDRRIMDVIGEITSLREIEPDPHLYAGGISAMGRGNYLKPHLDNSHDRNGARYRVLNLLYYVTPDWRESYGGNLELWDRGPKGTPRTIPSLFNRLVLMVTNTTSWHSVSEVLHDRSRCCVSNYYFSRISPEDQDFFHATSFRGRPGEVVNDLIMVADNAVRTNVLRIFGSTAYKNPHVYKHRTEC